MNTEPPPFPDNPPAEAVPAIVAPPVADAAAEAETSKPNLGENIAATIRKAAADAKEAAEAMLPKIKSTAERAAYGASYAASYGAVFAATLAKEVLPDPVLKGLSEGAAKAQDDATRKDPAPATPTEVPSA